MKNILMLLFTVMVLVACNSKNEYKVISDVPDLVMEENNLRFKTIKDYKNYKIVATHYVTDNNELRYILANNIAFKAISEGNSYPEGSILVNIAWSVKKMTRFTEAIEADEIQQIDYTIKDSENFSENPGNWGYASFQKRNGAYESLKESTQKCIACHNLAKDTDYKFSSYQKLQ